ncbi:MAG: MFS transporter, partial [Sciscionella sp.]
MWLGAAVWVIFEILFLAVALPSHNYTLVLLFYGLRGFGYPFFAFAFLVWINIASPENQRGTSVGWFWFAFTGGIPTLGSLFASGAIPLVGEFNTLWLSLVLVVIGGLFGGLAVRESKGSHPLVAKNAPKLKELFRGIDITWRMPRVTVGGLVRVINTAPEFGYFVFLPYFFTHTIGFSLPQYLQLVTIIYATNIFANLFFGVVGDHFGWRKTVTYFGGFGCTVSTLVLYYGPLAAHDNFLIAALCGALYGFTLAGYVPLSALLPAMTDLKDKGSSLAILNLGAGLAAFVGPAIVRFFRTPFGISGLIWIFAGLYLVSGLMSYFLDDASDPGGKHARLRRSRGSSAGGAPELAGPTA